MPPLIARPAMWTYLIAVAAATLLLAILDGRIDGPHHSLSLILVLGQLWLLAAWAATGQSPRIVRGFGLLLGFLAMTGVICCWEKTYSLASYKDQLGAVFFVTTPAFVSALLVKLAFDWRGVGPRKRFSFQIKEALAWMAMVAVFSMLWSATDFSFFDPTDATLVTISAASVAAGIIGAVWHREAISYAVKVTLSLFLVCLLAIFLLPASMASARTFVLGSLGGEIYVIAAFLLRSYDDRNFRRRLEVRLRRQQPLALSEHD